MKQTFYDFIKTCIEAGHWVAVQHNDGDWRVFTFINGDGDLQGTFSEDTIKMSLNSGLATNSYTEDGIEHYFTTNYKIVTPTPKLLKAGDKCEILDSELIREIAQEEEWDDKKVEMIGKKAFEIQSVNYEEYYTIWTKNKSDWFTFPHWAVAPYFEEETKIDLTDEELIRELQKRNLVIEGKVLK